MTKVVPPAEQRRGTEPWGSPVLNTSSWVLSLVLHVGLLALLGTVSWVTIQATPERQLRVGIVVKEGDETGDSYRTESNVLRPQPESVEEVPFQPVELPETTPTAAVAEVPAVDLAPIGVVGAPVGGSTEATVVPVPGPSTGAPARASFFKAEAWGQRFVFVIDRSGSMATNNALGVAKQELLRALNALPPHVQFQVVFYNLNADPLPMNQGRLVYAEESSKQQVRELLKTIAPAGGTDHLPALRLALVRLKADTVFFLTDADEMTLKDVEEVTRLNTQHATIHAIEFGLGPDLDESPALRALAERNGGTYRYVDTTRFSEVLGPSRN